MEIKQSDFVISAVTSGQYPKDGYPEVAFVGKSNVGKSSLINGLVNQKNLAKTSQQPGKTRLINVFLINDDFHLIDVPGYGYAGVSKGMKEDWGRMMNEFLDGSEHLKHILFLIDIRHEPGTNDKEMFEWIRESGIPCSILATKADKLSKSQQQKAAAVICRSLGIKQNEILPISSISKQGRNELLDHIGRILEK